MTVLACERVQLRSVQSIVSAPDLKLTPAQIAFHITHVILEAICIPDEGTI